jgi:hypothetical protein
VLDYVVRTSENLGIGFQRLAQYTRFLHDTAEIRLTVQRDRAVLSHSIPVPGGLPRPIAEYIVATWLLTSRQATGVNCLPRRTHRSITVYLDAHQILGTTATSWCSREIFSPSLWRRLTRLSRRSSKPKLWL